MSLEIQWVRRNLLECESDVTLELIEQLMKHTACTRDTIHEVLQTPAMKKHLTPVARKFGLTGVRYTDKRAENGRRAPSRRKSSLDYSRLASRYDREKIMRRFGQNRFSALPKRYDISDVGLAKVCNKLSIPQPGRGYWAIKAAGKPIPKRPPLPELFT